MAPLGKSFSGHKPDLTPIPEESELSGSDRPDIFNPGTDMKKAGTSSPEPAPMSDIMPPRPGSMSSVDDGTFRFGAAAAHRGLPPGGYRPGGQNSRAQGKLGRNEFDTGVHAK
jgi:hypothetical protein